ncbi:hypothetical protein RJT34_17643 [Clitoria ternatea]|uniref:Ferritin n=1 Tax=Clitoria ternatea TaxID=43366 RepID=A0AAN9J9B8_CLITE
MLSIPWRPVLDEPYGAMPSGYTVKICHNSYVDRISAFLPISHPDTPRACHTPLSSRNPSPPPVHNLTVQNPLEIPKLPLPTTTYTFFIPFIFIHCHSEPPPIHPFPFPFLNPFPDFALMALASSKVSSFSGFSLSPVVNGDAIRKPTSSSLSFNVSSNPSSLSTKKFGSRNLTVCASTAPLTGVLFEPFEEVKKDELAIPTAPQVSLARQNYADDCESAINEQINVEYNASYVYHSLFAYFDRDNVALKGFAKFFKESSEEEREHAEKLMKYQNVRGGRVVLHPIKNVPSEFEHVEKGDALYAMELALSLEKLVNEKLLNVHSVADRNNDPQMADFIESEFLSEQVESIKKISEYVAQLRRVGKGHGVWHFDQKLLD